MAVGWFVLRSKPNKETLLWEQLNIRKVETFYPQIRVQPVNPRSHKVKPYFPGYVFIRADLDQLSPSMLQWMPGALGLVSHGEGPSNVPDSLVAAIRKRVGLINAAGGELFVGLKKGDLVEIQSGPFAGHEAIFDARLAGTERARVLLLLLQNRRLVMDLPINFLRTERA